MSLGAVLIELRRDRNVSQKEVSDAIGISQSTIAKIEINRNEATASTLRKLAEFFNVTTDYLLELEDDFGIKKAPAVSRIGDSAGLSEEEKELVQAFRGLLPETKQTVLGLINSVSTTAKKNKPV